MCFEEGRIERRDDRPPVHVLRHGQPEQGQDRWGDIEDRRLVEILIADERIPMKDQDSVFAMPIGGLSVADA